MILKKKVKLKKSNRKIKLLPSSDEELTIDFTMIVKSVKVLIKNIVKIFNMSVKDFLILFIKFIGFNAAAILIGLLSLGIFTIICVSIYNIFAWIIPLMQNDNIYINGAIIIIFYIIGVLILRNIKRYNKK